MEWILNLFQLWCKGIELYKSQDYKLQINKETVFVLRQPLIT